MRYTSRITDDGASYLPEEPCMRETIAFSAPLPPSRRGNERHIILRSQALVRHVSRDTQTVTSTVSSRLHRHGDASRNSRCG